MTEKRDWYTIIRRLSFIAFILLAFWGAIHASSLYTVWNGMQPHFIVGESFRQVFFVVLWPITYAPIWWKVAFFTLGFWLLLPYFPFNIGTA